jgi:hypothetical protein
MRHWLVTFTDGETMEVEAEYRGAARHYARRATVAPVEQYKTVASARLLEEA